MSLESENAGTVECAMKELEKLEEELKTDKTYSVHLKILNFFRRHNIRRPDLVVLSGNEILFGPNAKPSLLGQELWNTYEQLLRAALDLNQVQLAQDCMNALQDKFKDSVRVSRLEGLLLEASGEFEDAEYKYDDILKQYPSDKFCLRRKVALYKSINDLPKAVEALQDYLKVYLADIEAYQELADLYLSVGDYKKAAFTAEDLILCNPHHFAFHLKYADILYTLGDYQTSRKYYAQSLNLKKENNMRALYGLLLCTKALDSQNSSTKASKQQQEDSSINEKNAKLKEFAQKTILGEYLKKSKSLREFMTEFVKEQQ